jgi:hypothetical protein
MNFLDIHFPVEKVTLLVSFMTKTSGITQNCVGETLLLNEPPFVYLLWKIHFLTCDNISLTLLFFYFLYSLPFYTARLLKFQWITQEDGLVCRFKERSRNGPQTNIFFGAIYSKISRDLLTVILKGELGTTLCYA